MHVLPVLDLLGGLVVRGVGGRRDEYRPIESWLSAGADPLAIARGFRDQLGLTRLYVADLDAILHARPNCEVYGRLSADGFTLMIDAGLRDVTQAEALLAAGATQVIAGLETWSSPEELARLCRRVGRSQVVFSLDLKDGAPLGDLSRWAVSDPFSIAVRAVEAGVAELIVLDLAQVGLGKGVTTAGLCRTLRQLYPQLRLVTGGGVRDAGDLGRLAELGIESVLVASALHDGRIGRRDIESAARDRSRSFRGGRII